MSLIVSAIKVLVESRLESGSSRPEGDVCKISNAVLRRKILKIFIHKILPPHWPYATTQNLHYFDRVYIKFLLWRVAVLESHWKDTLAKLKKFNFADAKVTVRLILWMKLRVAITETLYVWCCFDEILCIRRPLNGQLVLQKNRYLGQN